MEVRTGRRFEFEAFKSCISKKTKFVVSILYTTFALFGAVYVRTLISKYGLSCYSIYWIAYFIYVLFIYPIVLLYFKTRPKTYKVTMAGIIIDGQKIKWRNFKRISIEDDRIVLEKTFGDSLVIPIELKDDILKFAPRELVRTGLSHHRSARRSVIIPSNLS